MKKFKLWIKHLLLQNSKSYRLKMFCGFSSFEQFDHLLQVNPEFKQFVYDFLKEKI